jgi:hypothetical protein
MDRGLSSVVSWYAAKHRANVMIDLHGQEGRVTLYRVR